jgi:hypothetical protein
MVTVVPGTEVYVFQPSRLMVSALGLSDQWGLGFYRSAGLSVTLGSVLNLVQYSLSTRKLLVGSNTRGRNSQPPAARRRKTRQGPTLGTVFGDW